ncbi:MAG: imidazolonepropionase [Planctomycetota bacterium]|nr:MAG: imidazolonepropionase [Planctomycetota bacterium]
MNRDNIIEWKIGWGVFFLIIFLFPLSSLQGHDEIPGSLPGHPILVHNVILHTGRGEVFSGGWLLFSKGKILALGKGKLPTLPPGTQKINGHGGHLYPGLILANTALGLLEINSVEKTVDLQELGKFHPEVKGCTAVNPDSELVPVTRANGILSALVVPQGGLISGRSSLMYLDGWTVKDMTIAPVVGLHIRWPERSPRWWYAFSGAGNGEKWKKIQKESLAQLDDFLEKVRLYLQAREKEKSGSVVVKNLRFESLRDFLKGRKQVFIHVQSYRGILEAISWSKKQNLKIVLVGCAEVEKAIPLLRELKIPVILTRILRLPYRRDMAYDTPYRLPLILYKSKILFAIATSGSSFTAAHERSLPYEASMAIAFGLPKEAALQAITYNVAKILGYDSRLGSLEKGKDATFFISQGEIFSFQGQVKMAFLAGKRVSLNNKHKRLYQKYGKRYQNRKGSPSNKSKK